MRSITNPMTERAAAATVVVRRADRTAALLLALITAPVTVPGRSTQVPLAAIALMLPVVAGLAVVLTTTWCSLLTAGIRSGISAGRPTAPGVRELAAAERHVLLTAAAWSAGVLVTSPVPRTWTSFWFAGSLLCLLLAVAPRHDG